MTVKAPTELRALRTELRHAREDLTVIETLLDELGIDTHSAGGARYRTMGRMRRLVAEVKRLRKVERTFRDYGMSHND